jgi:hypothetical protein
MTCNEIENRLPAYLEDLLTPEEQKDITEHLASCPRCSRAFEDLKRADRLVRGIEEVEPPPFFEQKIMSRVREEAGRKQGILQRLFYPLHIKVPIQALATLLVAVLAFYVYQTGDPEMKQMAPLPIPLAEPQKDQVKAESPKAVVPPSAVTPVKRAPAVDFPEKGGQRFAAPPFEKGGKEEGMADSWTPIREERPAMKSADTILAAREKEGQPISTQALGQTLDKAERPDADQALESPLPKQKRKEKTAGTGGAAGERREMMSAPSPSRITAKAAIRGPATDLTIQAGDTDVVIREIKARLDQINALIIESRHGKESGFLKAEIAARNFAVFLDLIKEIGRVELETAPPLIPNGNVIVNINIVRHP